MSRDASHYHPDDRLLVVIGMASGASVALGSLASSGGADGVSWLMVLMQATVAAQGGAAVLWILRKALRWAVGRAAASHATLDAYRRRDTATYTVFLLTLATALGVQLAVPVVSLLLALFGTAQWRVMRAALRHRAGAPGRVHEAPASATLARAGDWAVPAALGAIGAAAALQGFAWLRMLTTSLGSGDGMTAVLLGALLLGAGVGLAGGQAIVRALGTGRFTPAVLMLLAALWSAMSVRMVPAVAAIAAVESAANAVAVGCMVLAVPMVLAGAAAATLLAGDAERRAGTSAHVGTAAVLAGGTVALVLTVDVLLAFLGVRGVAWSAMAVWIVAAAAALVGAMRRESANEEREAVRVARGTLSPRGIAAATATLGGLIAAEAVLWCRLIGATNGNRSDTIAHAFAAVLVGTALGLAASGRVQARLGLGSLRLTAMLTAIGGVVFYVAWPAGAALMISQAAVGRGLLLVAAAASSALCAACAPAMGTLPGRRQGPSMMGIMVLGASAGAVGMGWVLLDVETVEHAALFVAIAALGVAQGLWMSAPERPRAAGVSVLSLVALALLAGHVSLYRQVLERLHFGARASDRAYALVVQGRDGVVGTMADGQAYADGLYLGDYRTPPAVNAAVAHGAALVPALHRTPRRLLLLGLGTGARALSLTAMPDLESLTIVEPNARLLDALWRHREVAAVLDDPRVRLHEDDSRRWLMRHADARYDVILTHGPWSWRGGATRLVSAEFQQLVKSRLAPRGVAYLDASGSLDVLYTASGVWRHLLRVGSYVVASDAPFDQTADERRAAIVGDRARVLESADERTLLAALDQVSGDVAPALRRANDLWYITDDNLAAEFKATGAGAWWRALPARVWRPDRAWPTVLF